MKVIRNYRGQFKKKPNKLQEKRKHNIIADHNYVSEHLCNGRECNDEDCRIENEMQLGKHVSRSGWRAGRRIVEFDVLLSSLNNCKLCCLGPVPLTFYNIVGELQRGLGGYLYVKCANVDCENINIVPYGKAHREGKTRGIPSFVVNTKLGTDICKSLLHLYMNRDIAAEETQHAAKEMVGLVDDLGNEHYYQRTKQGGTGRMGYQLLADTMKNKLFHLYNHGQPNIYTILEYLLEKLSSKSWDCFFAFVCR